MPRPLSPATSLDLLKSEAKRWLKAIRRGDEAARARLRGALRDAPDAPLLRDVQHALAVEYGFAGWAALKRKVADIEAQRGHDVDIFDAIRNDRLDRIPAILERDPAALHRPFGAYATCDAESAHLTPLAWATFHDKPRAVRARGLDEAAQLLAVNG